MFDSDFEFSSSGYDDGDDFDYYVSFLKPLEEEEFSKGMIVRELMEEFDLEKEEAVKIFKRYLEEKSSMEEDDFIDDTVEDDDYSDGNRSNI